jgi:hypothetical protein
MASGAALRSAHQDWQSVRAVPGYQNRSARTAEFRKGGCGRLNGGDHGWRNADVAAADGGVKSAIFGYNAARFYKLDLRAELAPMHEDGIAKLKAAYLEDGHVRAHRGTGGSNSASQVWNDRSTTPAPICSRASFNCATIARANTAYGFVARRA